MKQEWAKAYICRPRDNLKSHVYIDAEKRFKPSYENDDCPAVMSLLLGWEYARIWLRERDEFIQDRFSKSQPKRIKNDYRKWLEKRFRKNTPKTCIPYVCNSK